MISTVVEDQLRVQLYGTGEGGPGGGGGGGEGSSSTGTHGGGSSRRLRTASVVSSSCMGLSNIKKLVVKSNNASRSGEQERDWSVKWEGSGNLSSRFSSALMSVRRLHRSPSRSRSASVDSSSNSKKTKKSSSSSSEVKQSLLQVDMGEAADGLSTGRSSNADSRSRRSTTASTWKLECMGSFLEEEAIQGSKSPGEGRDNKEMQSAFTKCSRSMRSRSMDLTKAAKRQEEEDSSYDWGKESSWDVARHASKDKAAARKEKSTPASPLFKCANDRSFKPESVDKSSSPLHSRSSSLFSLKTTSRRYESEEPRTPAHKHARGNHNVKDRDVYVLPGAAAADAAATNWSAKLGGSPACKSDYSCTCNLCLSNSSADISIHLPSSRHLVTNKQQQQAKASSPPDPPPKERHPASSTTSSDDSSLFTSFEVDVSGCAHKKNVLSEYVFSGFRGKPDPHEQYVADRIVNQLQCHDKAEECEDKCQVSVFAFEEKVIQETTVSERRSCSSHPQALDSPIKLPSYLSPSLQDRLERYLSAQLPLSVDGLELAEELKLKNKDSDAKEEEQQQHHSGCPNEQLDRFIKVQHKAPQRFNILSNCSTDLEGLESVEEESVVVKEEAEEAAGLLLGSRHHSCSSCGEVETQCPPRVHPPPPPLAAAAAKSSSEFLVVSRVRSRHRRRSSDSGYLYYYNTYLDRSSSEASTPRLGRNRGRAQDVAAGKKKTTAVPPKHSSRAWRESSGRAGQKLVDLPASIGTHKVRESVPVMKNTFDPYGDFRASMIAMIVEKNIQEAGELEQLLQAYLALNRVEYHHLIVAVFADVWQQLFDD